MNAVAIPIDLARIRDAVERLDLPEVDLRGLDLSDLEALRRDLARRLDDAGLQRDLQRLLKDIDLPNLDLPDLDALFGRKRPGVFSVTGGSLFVGTLAMLGGLALGGLVAFFLHPSKGQRRRKAVRKRLGRVKRRLLP
jgi:hypothetical protein